MSKFVNGWTRPRMTELLAAAGVLTVALVIVGQHPRAQEAELIIRNGLIVIANVAKQSISSFAARSIAALAMTVNSGYTSAFSRRDASEV